jgi:hypothetical protein
VAIKHVVTRGFGFSDGTKYIPTRGYLLPVVDAEEFLEYTAYLRVADFSASSRVVGYTSQDRVADFASKARAGDFTGNPRNPDFAPQVR